MKNQMTRSFKPWLMVPFMIMPLLISLACLTSTRVPTATSISPTNTSELADPGSVESNVDFGPGTFNFPDTEEGIADLSSYKATLILTFDGTQSGQSLQWSKTYVMLAAKDPAAHQLTIERTGVESDSVFMAEVEGALYEKHGEDACAATLVEGGNSLSARLEPAGFLNGIIGAEEAGSETVNNVVTNHYTFDERAFGQTGIAQSTGGMWVSSNGNYVVKYILTTKGNTDYFGDETEGTLTQDYELTSINQPVTITLPDGCPAGTVNAPLLPDASNTLNMPSLLTYDSSTSLTDATAFYQTKIPDLGWDAAGEPTITDTSALLDFTQDDRTMTILITTSETGTIVHVVLGNAPK